MTDNPWFDPLGLTAATINAAKRAAAQQQEAIRQAKLTAAKADVATAFAAWTNQPDRTATVNLQEAVATYLSIVEP